MRIALAGLATLLLAACSKPAPQAADTPQASAAAGADAAAPSPAPAAAEASNSGNAALKSAHQETSAASAGANSFTEAQAREHLRNAGYTQVSGLTQDSNGVWHGTASKGGKPLPVSLDFKGDISTQ